jgi:hypothetical protein
VSVGCWRCGACSGRAKVFHISYGDVRTDTGLAVFTDIGRGFRNFSDLGSDKIQAVVGGGSRSLAASQIVAKIDVRMGNEASPSSPGWITHSDPTF